MEAPAGKLEPTSERWRGGVLPGRTASLSQGKNHVFRLGEKQTCLKVSLNEYFVKDLRKQLITTAPFSLESQETSTFKVEINVFLYELNK